MLLSRGASPSAACQHLGLPLALVARSLADDADFQRLQDRINALLSQNVAAALYRSAMEGSVSAQTFYLKNCPPPEWPDASPEPAVNPLDELTDDELIARFRQDTLALLAQLPGESSESPGDDLSGNVS